MCTGPQYATTSESPGLETTLSEESVKEEKSSSSNLAQVGIGLGVGLGSLIILILAAFLVVFLRRRVTPFFFC